VFNRDDSAHAGVVIINILVRLQRVIAQQPNTRCFKLMSQISEQETRVQKVKKVQTMNRKLQARLNFLITLRQT
jgi:hypothetical protein